MKVQRLDEIGEVAARPSVQVRQHARAQSFRGARPGRVEVVDERREVPLGRHRTGGRRRQRSIAVDRQPAQRRVEQVRDDVADTPGARDRRSLPVFRREPVQQIDDLTTERTQHCTGIRDRKRHQRECTSDRPREAVRGMTAGGGSAAGRFDFR